MWSPFVEPEVVRLTLTHGQWLDVKRELTYGELQEMYARMQTQYGPGEAPKLDPTKIGRARMVAYIVAWSFTDPQGRPVPMTPSALENLKGPVAGEIRDALEAHEDQVARAVDAEKNDPDGANVSSPISPSVS